jgi:hypothetical protein
MNSIPGGSFNEWKPPVHYQDIPYPADGARLKRPTFVTFVSCLASGGQKRLGFAREG